MGATCYFVWCGSGGFSSASPAPQNLTTTQDGAVLDDDGVEHTRKGKCASYS